MLKSSAKSALSIAPGPLISPSGSFWCCFVLYSLLLYSSTSLKTSPQKMFNIYFKLVLKVLALGRLFSLRFWLQCLLTFLASSSLFISRISRYPLLAWSTALYLCIPALHFSITFIVIHLLLLITISVLLFGGLFCIPWGYRDGDLPKWLHYRSPPYCRRSFLVYLVI